MPFRVQEIQDAGGIYYGVNAVSKNLLICNRKRLLNPHGFILGVSGSGKSFSMMGQGDVGEDHALVAGTEVVQKFLVLRPELLQLIGDGGGEVVVGVLLLLADTLEQLNADTETLQAIGNESLCQFSVLRYQQEDGLNTALPYGLLVISRGLMWWGLLGEISITAPPRARVRSPYSRSASMMIITSRRTG